MRVVATAGHVDHGKSTLIRALTGTDPDRFPEEKARGLTIDLGFAFVDVVFPDGATDTVGFVDVPGHVRFVKNMLAGVGAVETAMLIVAANEGWMPQTEEHVRILELLGIDHGLIVLTKADTVDEETLELAQLDVAERVAGRALESWPVVVSDAVSGRGLDDVRATLAAVLAAAPGARDEHRARLWVDRSFAARGAGTVVTGTLALGWLAVDDEVVVQPGGAHARVRGIESNHERLTRVGPGARVALNLAGVDHDEITRGAAVVAADVWATTLAFDARVLPVRDVALPRRATLAVHVGSGEWAARWRLLDSDGGYARVRLDTPLPVRPGDRVVLRSTGRRLTVGGVEVLDIEPARRTVVALERLSRPAILRASAAQPFADTAELVRLAGLDPTTAPAALEAAGLVRLAGR
jgi:selenocysteine-specific elongation factor